MLREDSGSGLLLWFVALIATMHVFLSLALHQPALQTSGMSRSMLLIIAIMWPYVVETLVALRCSSRWYIGLSSHFGVPNAATIDSRVLFV